jgi:hypothetical protein
MPRRTSTKIFVPSATAIPRSPGVVATCHKRYGDSVQAEDALFDIRFADTDAEVLAPVSGTLMAIHVATGDTVSVGWPLADIATDEDLEEAQPTGALSRTVDDRAPFVLGLALSAPALIWPIFWLVVVLLGSLLSAGSEQMRARPSSGAIDLVLVPLRVLAGAARWLGTWLTDFERRRRGVVRVLLCLAIVAVGTALVSGGLWLSGHGSDGLVAALRLAGFEHLPRIFVFLVCASFLSRALSATSRKLRLTHALGTLPAGAVALAMLVLLAWTGLCAAVLPHQTWWPASSLRAVGQSLPGGLDVTVGEWRRSLAEEEAVAVVDCVTEKGHGGWLPAHASLGGDGGVIVAVSSHKARRANDRSLAVLMLALQNQLAPSASFVVIHTGHPNAKLSYQPVATDVPISDPKVLASRIAPSAGVSRHLKALNAMPADDVAVALDCSAVAF